MSQANELARYRAFPEPPPRESMESVVVRAPNWVGDVVAATPILESVQQHFSHAKLAILIKHSLADVLRGSPLEGSILPFRAKARERVGDLRRAKFDLGILLTHSFSSAWTLYRGHVKRRLGYAGGLRGWLLNDRVRPLMEGLARSPHPMVRTYADLVSVIGVSVADTHPRLAYDADCASRADGYLERQGIDPTGPWAVLHPGAAFGSSKHWDARSVAHVVDGLQGERDLPVYIHGGPGEQQRLSRIRRLCRTNPAGADRESVDLHLLKALVDRAALLVSTDSGPRHYGVAFDVPSVILMGPTDPRYTNAHLEHTQLLRVSVDCGPCQQKSCVLDHRCMTGIRAVDILTACDRALA